MPNPIDLTPNESMASAAATGLALVTESDAGIEPAARARARKIAAKATLTAAQVKRMAAFFAESKIAREPGWEKTPAGIMHMLWGGDAGKAWVAARVKALAGAGVSMDEDERIEFAEMFFGGDRALFKDVAGVEMDDDGLIWKPMLPAGVWKIGPNGRPLKIVVDKSPDQRQAIGMQDIIDAFNASAVPHVTVPKTHDDAVDENTGFVRKLKVANFKGIPTLFGGHDFTDKKIKGKVLEGSIANTSVGLEFDYVRKDDGKKFPVVLRHNALTNRPWLGRRLAPFGVTATEGETKYQVMCGEFSEPLAEGNAEVDLWDNALTYAEVRDAIGEQVDCEVVDIAVDRVLLKDGDKNFVARFIVDDGEVVLDERQKWIERNVQLEEEHREDDHTTAVNDKSTSGSTDNIDPSATDNDHTKEAAVPEKKTEEKETSQGTQPAQVDLSENPQFKEMLDENATLKAKLSQLVSKDREREADDFIGKLKGMGLDEEHGCTGFLKKTRNILLSDEGQTALLLSEDDESPRPISVGALVRELLLSLPTEDGKLKIQLAEQHTDPLGKSSSEKPPEKPEGEGATLSERESAADAWFEENRGQLGIHNPTITKES